ncbi:MAG: hypothetical protein KDI49_12735 [Gammaproteobacteria bacterium]|nr:hypothetical protein [Gammaproteobacteria bacterium]
MKQHSMASSIVMLAILMFAFSSAHAETPVFGPEEYVRETGKPQQVSNTFSVQDPSADYSIVVQNGEGKRGRVSSAIIYLNGERIIEPDEFNKQVDVITKPVSLDEQNELAVQVRSEPGSSLIVTVLGPDAPPPSPISGLTVSPDGFPINVPTQVTFTAKLPYDPAGPVPTLELQLISQSGDVLGMEGHMVDSGDLSLGDEIEGDGVFAFRKTYEMQMPGKIHLRIKVDVDGEILYSEAFQLITFTPISDDEAAAINVGQTDAEQLYRQLVPSIGEQEAMAQVVAYLKELPQVEDAGISDGGASIWVEYTNGMEGVILTNPPGTRGGAALFSPNAQITSTGMNIPVTAALSGNAQVQSKRVLLLSPFRDEFGSTDEGTVLKALYENHNTNSGCPKYDIVYLENSQVGVGSFKALGSYGIVHIATHGTVSNGRVVVLTKASTSTQNLQTYQSDLQNGRLITASTSTGTWLAATPKFFTYYIQTMPSTLVFFSSCYSTFNNSLSSVLLGKGAKSYLGFSHVVPSSFAYGKSEYFHEEWVEDPLNLVTTGEVFNNGCTTNSLGVSVCWNLAGANDLEAPPGDQLQDGGFESGALGTWSAQGDGRVVSQLGTFAPTEGSYSGLISTGLGFTTDSGSVSQSACIPANAATITFDWNFTSEEFQEWCGSIYQDFFRVDLVSSNGATTNLLYRKVDDLCASTSPVSFSFDQGDAWSTGWRSQSVDISAFAAANAGKSAELKFSAGDVGDSIYDTAILIDNVQINAP